AMTANALEGDRAKCLAAGMDDYVSKPVKLEELGVVLDKLLSETSHTSHPLQHTNGKPVDMERLFQVMGKDPEEQAEIIGVYLAQMSANLSKLEQAIAARNDGEISFILHNCIGTSANCGMVAVLDPLRELETQSRENRFADAASLLSKINGEFDRVKNF